MSAMRGSLCRAVSEARTSAFKVMIPIWNLNSANCFGSAFSIRDKELHVLVELSNTLNWWFVVIGQ
jgi:hypothetical protein